MKSVTLTKAAFDVLIHQIKQLTKERDEARRFYCSENSLPHGTSAENVAKCMGWDCYKTETQEETQ